MNPPNGTGDGQAILTLSNIGNSGGAPPGGTTSTTMNLTQEQAQMIKEWMQKAKAAAWREAINKRFPRFRQAFWSIQQLPRDQQLPKLQQLQKMMLLKIDWEIKRVQAETTQAMQAYEQLYGELQNAYHNEPWNMDRVQKLEKAFTEKKSQIDNLIKRDWSFRCQERKICQELNVLQFESRMVFWFGLPRPTIPNAPIVPQPGAQFHAQAPMQPNNTSNTFSPQTWNQFQPQNSSYPSMHPAQVQPNYIPNPAMPQGLPSQAQLAYSFNPETYQVQMQPVPIPNLPPVISDQPSDWFNQPGFNLIPAHEQSYALRMYNMRPPQNNGIPPNPPQISNPSHSSGVGQALALPPSGMAAGDEPAENGNNHG